MAAAVANEAAAERHAATVLPIIREIKRAGARTLREIAEALNVRGVQTARGGQWYAMTVRNVLVRMPSMNPFANLASFRIHLKPARSIFSKALNFCRSAIAVLVRSP
jgi:Recombinase